MSRITIGAADLLGFSSIAYMTPIKNKKHSKYWIGYGIPRNVKATVNSKIPYSD